jgi:hypothetical protein
LTQKSDRLQKERAKRVARWPLFRALCHNKAIAAVKAAPFFVQKSPEVIPERLAMIPVEKLVPQRRAARLQRKTIHVSALSALGAAVAIAMSLASGVVSAQGQNSAPLAKQASKVIAPAPSPESADAGVARVEVQMAQELDVAHPQTIGELLDQSAKARGWCVVWRAPVPDGSAKAAWRDRGAHDSMEKIIERGVKDQDRATSAKWQITAGGDYLPDAIKAKVFLGSKVVEVVPMNLPNGDYNAADEGAEGTTLWGDCSGYIGWMTKS